MVPVFVFIVAIVNIAIAMVVNFSFKIMLNYDFFSTFPVFNLAEVYSSETLLGKKLNQSNGVLRKAFVTSYGKVFEK